MFRNVRVFLAQSGIYPFKVFADERAETARLREELDHWRACDTCGCATRLGLEADLASARAELARVAATARIVGCDTCVWVGPVEYHNGHLIDGEGDEQCDGNERNLTTPPASDSPDGLLHDRQQTNEERLIKATPVRVPAPGDESEDKC